MRKLRVSNPFCEVWNMRNQPHRTIATIDLNGHISRAVWRRCPAWDRWTQCTPFLYCSRWSWAGTYMWTHVYSAKMWWTCNPRGWALMGWNVMRSYFFKKGHFKQYRVLPWALSLEVPEVTLQPEVEAENDRRYELSHLSRASVPYLSYPTWENGKSLFSLVLGTECPVPMPQLFRAWECTPSLSYLRTVRVSVLTKSSIHKDCGTLWVSVLTGWRPSLSYLGMWISWSFQIFIQWQKRNFTYGAYFEWEVEEKNNMSFDHSPVTAPQPSRTGELCVALTIPSHKALNVDALPLELNIFSS